MRLEWTLQALGDLRETAAFINRDNPSAAARIADRIQTAAEILLDHPHLGRPGRRQLTRAMVVSGTPLIIIYWVQGGAVQILRVLHHSRKWPAA